MYVFDALIYNPGRPPQSMIYSPDNWQLLLTGQQDSFASNHGRPAWLKPVELQLGQAWRAALTSIDDTTLQKTLGDVLDRRRLAALEKRRDELLEGAAGR
jgi:hypothetical protein